MKILNVGYVALAPFIGGSERSLQIILLEATKSKKINPMLFCPAKSPMYEWAKTNNIFTVQVALKETDSFLKVLKQRLQLVFLFRKYDIDIAHSNQVWSYPSLSLVPKLSNTKLVCHLRDPINEDIDWWLKVKADALVCVSKYIQDSLKSNYSAYNEIANIKTLINPISEHALANAKSVEESKIAARKKFSLCQSKITFGFIGQISPVKGVLEMLEMLSYCQTVDWQVIIAGHDTTKQQDYLLRCKTFATELGISKNVHFLGFLEETEDFYHSIDCVIMLSKEEPLGRVPLEAGAFSKPTIANSVGGLKEIIIHNETGILCKIDSLKNIAETIERTSLDEYDAMGINARRFVEKNASPSRYLSNLHSIYGKIIK